MNFGRISLAIIYIWFGLLKVIHLSPAEPLVTELLNSTMPFFEAGMFGAFFGLFEVVLGILFLFPKYARITMYLFIFHMITTALPLILLPQAT